jgi:hypothetical protein
MPPRRNRPIRLNRRNRLNAPDRRSRQVSLPRLAVAVLAVTLALPAAVTLASCGGGDGDGEGGQCQPCRSTQPQCDAGMSCKTFQGNFLYALCASPGTTSCKVPF